MADTGNIVRIDDTKTGPWQSLLMSSLSISVVDFLGRPWTVLPVFFFADLRDALRFDMVLRPVACVRICSVRRLCDREGRYVGLTGAGDFLSFHWLGSTTPGFVDLIRPSGRITGNYTAIGEAQVLFRSTFWQQTTGFFFCKCR